MDIIHSQNVNITASVPAIWHYATGIFSLVCLICGLFSNGLVIFVIIKNPNLRRPRNYFLINLAVTDLGLLLTNNTPHTIASFNKHWPFGQIGCSLYAICGGVFGLTSIVTMAVISLTRLVAVIDPLSSLKLTGYFTLKCIACSWIYGSVWIILPLFGWNRYIFEGFGTTCTFDYISKDFWDRLFIFIIVTGGFLVPFLIIIISYTVILMRLSKRSRHLMCHSDTDQSQQSESKQLNNYCFRQNKLLNDEPSLNEIATSLESTKNNRMRRNVRRTEARATRTALLVCAIFCLAWGPYTLMAILSQLGFDHLVNPYTTATLSLFTKIAACINPLIFALSSPVFRQYMNSRMEYYPSTFII